jgi:protease IV
MDQQYYYRKPVEVTAPPAAAAVNNGEPPAPPTPPAPPRSGYYRQHRKNANLWAWIIVAVLVVAIAVGGYWLLGKNMGLAEPMVNTYQQHIARIFVEGTIVSEYAGDYDQAFLIDTIDQLIANENNLALLVYIDSPGGEILASDELASKIMEYKETTGRPVCVYGHNMMASGGYWVACSGDWLVANKYCTTGSIGVTFGSMLDVSGFLESYGIKVNTITSGSEKSMGSMLEEMTPETRAIFQSIINEYYGYFLDWVGSRRGIAKAELQPLADGRVYTATQALNHQLIDQVGTYADALAVLDEELGATYPVADYLPQADLGWLDQLEWLNNYLHYQGDGSEALLKLLPPTGPLAYYQGQ